MSKEEKGLVPRLRFPEFDQKEWGKKKIGEFAQVSTGGTPSSTNKKYWNGDIPWMNSGELNLKRVRNVAGRITALGLKESSTRLIPPYCVLIGLAGQGKTRGTAAINYFELCTNQSIAAIHPNASIYNSEYLYQRIDSLYEELRSLSTGEGGRGGLNLNIIKSFEIDLPTKREQQKIADCLSSLDDLIAAESEKLDALKAHKKGLMQGLFPAEGEMVPRLRFKDFEGADEWRELRLGELVTIRSGSSPSNYEFEFGAKHAFLKVEDLNNCEKYQVTSRQYSNSIENLIPAQSVIFPKRGAAILNNKTRLSINEVLMDTNLMAITPDESTDTEFLYYLIVLTGLSKIADTSTIPQINNKHILPFKVLIPILEEQVAIGRCLVTVDDLLAGQNEILEKLIAHKRGLLQGLLPNSES